MKAVMIKPLKTLVICALVSVLAVACQSPTPASRIAAHSAMFSQLPVAQQALVQQGKICEGMGEDAVFLAWGRPDSPPLVGQVNGKKIARWVYKGYEPVTVMNNSPYPAWGPYGWYGYNWPTTSTAYIPRNVAYVEFVNGKVTAWASSKPAQN